ncbi:hypothetical protein VitviT2T_014419 [Vitis vinifera]|uniref:Protein FAM32A-like n=1 Tax=Vitis vinifera TaxID=29760 RepID=A0ABY9CMB2_VITVI|nr:hypothetical protein VitviT2T_014419 [Vitis vinifera]
MRNKPAILQSDCKSEELCNDVVLHSASRKYRTLDFPRSKEKGREGFGSLRGKKMSSYDNVIGGKLKLKGKALDVKAGGVKKKKKHKKQYDQNSEVTENELSADGSTRLSTDPNEEDPNDANKSSGEKNAAPYDDHLTPAERRYIEQREKLDVNRLARISNKSHRDRIQDFNQYLANMSEHYDIPKVGPG